MVITIRLTYGTDEKRQTILLHRLVFLRRQFLNLSLCLPLRILITQPICRCTRGIIYEDRNGVNSNIIHLIKYNLYQIYGI